MSLILIFGIVMLITILVSLCLALVIDHLLVGSVISICLVASVGFYTFNFLRKIGAYGYQKMLVKYFYRVEKIKGGRPSLKKIKLY